MTAYLGGASLVLQVRGSRLRWGVDTDSCGSVSVGDITLSGCSFVTVTALTPPLARLSCWPGRLVAWLVEVMSVALVQACQDARRAYRNWFDSLSGARKGRKLGHPRFRSRKDNRQSIRLTRNGFGVTTGGVRAAKVGGRCWLVDAGAVVGGEGDPGLAET